MRIRVDINTNRILNRFFDNDTRLFANTTLYRLCDPFVPFKEGGLSQNVDITKDFVHYKSLYADVIYNGKNMNFSKDKHSLATAEWDKVAMVSKKRQLVSEIENYIKRKG